MSKKFIQIEIWLSLFIMFLIAAIPVKAHDDFWESTGGPTGGNVNSIAATIDSLVRS